MGVLNPDPKKKSGSDLRQVSLLAAVPALLIAGPAIGFLIGQWADKKFDSQPYLVILGVVLGFAAAGREIYLLVKKAQALEDEDKSE